MSRMSNTRNIFLTGLYIFLRFTPVFAAFLVLNLTGLSVAESATVLDKTIRLAAVLAVWNMAEGLCMLWIREKNSQSANARGYGIVAILGGFLVLVILQVFRLTSSQVDFLVLLSALALRGMTRGAWEQGRPQLALFTSMGAHTLVVALSFLLALRTLPWPTSLIAASFGTLLGSVEVSWHGASFKGTSFRWLAPARRVGVVFGPLAVTTLALLGFLPPAYLSLFALVIVGSRLAKTCSTKGLVDGEELSLSAGMYLAFVVMMLTCRIFS